MTATAPPPAPDAAMPNKEGQIRHALAALLNRYSMENGSNTPDWILANYLIACLDAFDRATQERTKWYGPNEKPLSQGATPPAAGG